MTVRTTYLSTRSYRLYKISRQNKKHVFLFCLDILHLIISTVAFPVLWTSAVKVSGCIVAKKVGNQNYIKSNLLQLNTISTVYYLSV